MRKLAFSLALIGLISGVFAGLKNAGLVWDDRQVINGGAENALALPDTQAIWQIDRAKPFEPMVPTIWRLTQMIVKPPSEASLAKAFHLLSVTVHAANAVLVFLILVMLLQNAGAAGAGALLFAIHPLQVEAVAHIAAFKFVLGSFFALVAVWQYLAFLEAQETRMTRLRSRRHVYLATTAFILALLTSAAAAVTPLIAWLATKLLPKKSSLYGAPPPVWPLAAWALIALPQVVLGIAGQNTQAIANQLPLWSKPLVAADAVSFYLSKIFAPVFLGPDYGRSPMYVLAKWWGYLTWILPVVLCLVLTYWRSKARRWYLHALGLMVAALLPYLGLVYFEAQATSTVANRFVYLAMLGPALAAAYTISMPRRSWLPIVVVGATIAFGIVSRASQRHWYTDEDLWRHALSVNPVSPIAHATLADAFRRQGDWENARAHYEKVLETNTLTPDIHFYLGEIERVHGDPKKAMEYYERTIALDPKFADAHERLGLALVASKNPDAALDHLRKAVEIAPKSEPALRNLGMLYVRREAYNEAIPYLSKALQLGPPSADTEALLGLALARTNQPDAAQGHLEAALALDANHGEANRTLADIYFANAKYDLARIHYERAVAHGSGDFAIFNNLGVVLSMHKEYGKAAGYFAKALEIKPDAPETLNNIAVAYFRLKQFREASAAFNKALALTPNLADPHYFLGDIARWQGREGEALAEYYKALKIDPTHVDANFRLGNHFMKENKYNQAIHHYQAALKAAPEDPRLIYSLRKAEKTRSGESAVEF